MKTKLSVWMYAGMFLIFSHLPVFTVYSENFTAVRSGKWSVASTWGIKSPGQDPVHMNIFIPDGIVVTLDQFVVISGSKDTLKVNGSLVGAPGMELVVSSGTLSGSGKLTLSDFKFGPDAEWNFAGEVDADNFSNSGIVALEPGHLKVGRSLEISRGMITAGRGGFIQPGNDAMISINGGLLLNSGGIIDLDDPYSISYSGLPAETGLEARGNGLKNVIIDPGKDNEVVLSGTLSIRGDLFLKSGSLDLNGFDLIVNGNLMGTGQLTGNRNSNLVLNLQVTPPNPLIFSGGANEINNLVLNLQDGGTMHLGSDMNVDGFLEFISGGLDVGNHSLMIGTHGSILGTGPASYIFTDKGGFLGEYIENTVSLPVLFPVGTVSGYAPVEVLLNPGSNSGLVKISAVPGVFTNGNTGDDLVLTKPMVNTSWVVDTDVPALDMNIQISWSPGMEVNNFMRNEAFISAYTDSMWDTGLVHPSFAGKNGMFSLTRTHIGKPGTFAVFDRNTKTYIGYTGDEIRFEIYPDPVTEYIIIKGNEGDFDQTLNMDILDLNGRLIDSYKLVNNNTQVYLNKLKAGNYIIRLYNGKVELLKKITKI